MGSFKKDVLLNANFFTPFSFMSLFVTFHGFPLSPHVTSDKLNCPEIGKIQLLFFC